MTKTSAVLKDTEKYVVPCYKKYPIVFADGKGSVLKDVGGKSYIDFFSGWAVSSLGHSHPRIARAIADQAAKLIHIPNNYYNEHQAALAKTIVKSSFPGKVFFCNSGAESVEGAIKLARAYGAAKGRTDIITLNKSFHGRTTGAMSATAQSKYQKGMKPLLAGFKKAELNNVASVTKVLSSKTAAILFEPIQGEGGVRPADQRFMKWVREVCTKKDILLILDEVQTGMGRTGKMFCYQHYGIKPDVMLLAKSLGSGFPIGAIVAGTKVQNVLQPGMHASTFGGSPLASRAALEVFSVINQDRLVIRASNLGKQLMAALQEMKKKYPNVIADVRGKGLMVALELKQDAQSVMNYAMTKGLLINVTQGNVVRLAPSLNIPLELFRRALKILDESIKTLDQS